MKAKPWKSESQSGTEYSGYKIICEGCNQEHYIYLVNPGGPQWTFNGNLHKPTFSPSVRITWPEKGVERCCHFIITDGMIDFCGDCTHHMMGKKVELPEFKEE